MRGFAVILTLFKRSSHQLIVVVVVVCHQYICFTSWNAAGLKIDGIGYIARRYDLLEKHY